MFKAKLFKSRRILLGNCIFDILYVFVFALINFVALNFSTAAIMTVMFATGVLKPVRWMLKIDNAVRKYVDNFRNKEN